MSQTFLNVTDLRKNTSNLTKKAKQAPIILLKNGKPVLGLLTYKELEEYQALKQQCKKSQAIKQSVNNIFNQSQKLKQGEKYLLNKGYTKKQIKNLTDEKILEILEQD